MTLTLTKTCRECGDEFTVPDASVVRLAERCPTCAERLREARATEEAEEVGRRRRELWRRLCPPDFRATDELTLPRPALLTAVLAWQFGPMGLLLYGKTGLGKSRCAWKLIEREFRQGRSVRALDGTAGLEYAAQFGQTFSGAHTWMQTAIGADLLLLDDVFNARLTDSFESALFNVVSQRTERQRPTIVTTNDIGDSLLRRMTPERGPAFVRRLREFCRAISFQ